MNTLNICFHGGQKLLTWIRLIIVPWWPSWLSDQIAFSNPESDVGRCDCHLGYGNGMILAILTLHVAQMPLTKFGLSLTAI